MSATAGHTPMRQCRVCRKRRPQAELIRLGLPGHEGRGAYACADNDHCREILPRTLSGAGRKQSLR